MRQNNGETDGRQVTVFQKHQQANDSCVFRILQLRADSSKRHETIRIQTRVLVRHGQLLFYSILLTVSDMNQRFLTKARTVFSAFFLSVKFYFMHTGDKKKEQVSSVNENFPRICFFGHSNEFSNCLQNKRNQCDDFFFLSPVNLIENSIFVHFDRMVTYNNSHPMPCHAMSISMEF